MATMGFDNESLNSVFGLLVFPWKSQSSFFATFSKKFGRIDLMKQIMTSKHAIAIRVKNKCIKVYPNEIHAWSTSK